MMVRKSRFLLRFLSFHEGTDPRSARAGAVETPFFTSGLGSKTVVFFLQFHAVSLYLWDRNRSKRHQKSSLKIAPWKVYVFFCSGSVFGSLLPTLWTASSCLWDVMPSKSQGFLETEGWTPKDWCPTMSGGHWRFKVSAFSRIGDAQGHPKTTI